MPAVGDDALTADEWEEAKERRLAELEFIQSAYSPEEARVDGGTGDAGCCVVRLLQLQCDGDEAVKVELRIKMPTAYPVRENALLLIEGSLVSSPSNPQCMRRAGLEAVPQLVGSCQQTALETAEAQGGGEAVWSVLSRAEEWTSTEWASLLEEHSKSLACEQPKGADDTHRAIALGRRILYSHHIIANSKRRDIATLTSQYKLGGYMKIGWPGVILIEEEREEIPVGVDLDAYRMLPLKFEELGKDQMSLLASNCREAGLERMFLTCLQINDGRTVEGGAQNDGMQESDTETSIHAVLVLVDHMNDGKRYRKWLRKTCHAQGCTLMLKQFRLDNEANGRPVIYVGVFGDRDHVKQVMKLWRTSHVDVNSRNKQCLERMMVVAEEGAVQRLPRGEELDAESELECSLEELESLVSTIDAGWAQNLRTRHIPKR
ncbi:hypothetical protein ACHAXT_009218 [Thalassiosira profunda]